MIITVPLIFNLRLTTFYQRWIGKVSNLHVSQILELEDLTEFSKATEKCFGEPRPPAVRTVLLWPHTTKRNCFKIGFLPHLEVQSDWDLGNYYLSYILTACCCHSYDLLWKEKTLPTKHVKATSHYTFHLLFRAWLLVYTYMCNFYCSNKIK